MLLIDFREVFVDRKREKRVPVASHEVHLDLLADVELLPSDGDDAEREQSCLSKQGAVVKWLERLALETRAHGFKS